MALTLRTNGSSGANLVTASWWNDYYNLLTGSMVDQPVTLVPGLTLKGIGGGPGSAPTAAVVAGSSLGIGAYKYTVTFGDGSGGETIAGPSVTATTTSGNQNVNLSAIPTGATGTTKRNIYRTTVGGSTYQFLASINDNTTTTYSDTTADASLGLTVRPLHPSFGGSIFIQDSSSHTMLTIANDGTFLGNVLAKSWGGAPASVPTLALAAGTNLGIGVYKYQVTYLSGKTNINPGESFPSTNANITTTSGNQAVSLTAIPLGPAGTTGRRIYRTAVGGSSYLLLATISDNTTTTYSDTTADGSLGAAAPTHSSFGGALQTQDSSGNVKAIIYNDGTVWFEGGNIFSDGTGDLYLTGSLVPTFNVIAGGYLQFGGSGAQIDWYAPGLNIQYWTPQSGSANGHEFVTWNGSALKVPFSVGGQFGSALSWVDNAGSMHAVEFIGALQTFRNGTAQATTIFTGTTTPTANEVGDIWVNA
jgi:hypothetical protein